MKTKLKKLVRSAKCSVLSAALCVVGLAAWAEPQKIGDSDVTWELTEENTVLTIAGTGAMPDFEEEGAPWYGQRTSIQTLEIKSGVTRLGEYAFYSCMDMTSMTIPASVTSIAGNAFFRCNMIAELRIDSIESWCKISFGIGESTPFKVMPSYPHKVYVGGAVVPTTDLVIPDGIEILNKHVFSVWDMLTSVTIPSSVTSIGGSAFSYCSGLESVTIPSSVTNIGAGAFSLCSGLESVVIPSSVTSIGSDAFNSCKGLKSVTIPLGVTSIGNDAFSYCSGLESVTIPSSVTNIGMRAFQDCSGLKSVMIPSSVERIGDSAFNNCSKTMSVIEMRETPPKAGSSVFGTPVKFKGTICVPIESLLTYKQTSPWSNYRNQTMPAYMVYGVAEHGAVEMSKNCFPTNEYTTASETVTVTATPDEGYLFKSLVWNDGTDHDITKAKSFTMPLKSVTVTAVFEEAAESDEEVVATAEATFVLGPALAVANVTTATHWPWDGKIDVTCDLTGSGKVQLSAALTTNGVTVCTAKAANLTGATEIDLDQVGGVTNGVKFVWNAKADCPAGFNSTDTKVKVTAKKVKSLPVGALPGEFTVSAEGKKVHFSKGNLWYGKVGDAQTATFQFEANQYEFHGYDSANNTWGLFGWVGASSPFTSSPEIYGVTTSETYADYGNVKEEAHKADWGTAIDDKGTWSTLSTAEWQYLFNTRTMANGGARYENLTTESGITVESVIFKGVVLFPDNFTEQADWKTKYTTWEALNNAGIVFLPAAGVRRVPSGVIQVGSYGYYRSSSAAGEKNAYIMMFKSSEVNPDYSAARRLGYSVRLVTEVK